MELKFIPRFALGILAVGTALLGSIFVIAGWNWVFGPLSLMGWFLLLACSLTLGKNNYKRYLECRRLVLNDIRAEPCQIYVYYARVWDAYRKTKGMLDREAAYTLIEWHLHQFVDEGYAEFINYPGSEFPYVGLTSAGSAYKQLISQ